MASGVPEHEVWAAADAVLARGERPTVERVRTELGRGSPARVGQLLEQWWEQLAQRLKGHALLPELPGEVAQAFAEAWRLALAHADTSAQAALSEEQNCLFAMQTSLTQERKLWDIALDEAKAQAADAITRWTESTAHLRERQILIEQLELQRADLLQQRNRLEAQLAKQQAALDALWTEHANLEEHVRASEDRAHQQVDQARQEVKALQQELTRAQRDHARVTTQHTAREHSLHAALRTAEQTAAHQAGRVSALEVTIAKWQKARMPAPRAVRKASTKGAEESATTGRSRKKG